MIFTRSLCATPLALSTLMGVALFCSQCCHDHAQFICYLALATYKWYVTLMATPGTRVMQFLCHSLPSLGPWVPVTAGRLTGWASTRDLETEQFPSDKHSAHLSLKGVVSVFCKTQNSLVAEAFDHPHC